MKDGRPSSALFKDSHGVSVDKDMGRNEKDIISDEERLHRFYNQGLTEEEIRQNGEELRAIISLSDESCDLAGFSCPLNKDVERFLKQQSVEFAKKHQAVTYLQHFHIGWCQCLHQHITVKAGQIQTQKGNEKDCAQPGSRFSLTASPGIG